MNDRVRFELADEFLGVVTLDRPDKRNAMDQAFFDGLHAVAAQAGEAIADRSCRAVLVIGSGKAFSAGLDTAVLGQQASRAATGGEVLEDGQIARLQDAFTAFEDLGAPVVAAVHGVAIGAGCQLALACHLRLAAPDAVFGLLEAKWGLVCDLGATYRLPRIVGLGRATQLAVEAETIDARTARDWGLVNAVLDVDDFAAAARGYAARLARGPVLATGATPRLMRTALASPRDHALAAERAAQLRCVVSADFAEAVRAGQAGQRPDFSGR